MPARVLTLDAVAEELAISRAQVWALVRRGDRPAGKIGGRVQWRVDRAHLETYLERTWAETAVWVQQHPLSEGEESPAAKRQPVTAMRAHASERTEVLRRDVDVACRQPVRRLLDDLSVTKQGCLQHPRLLQAGVPGPGRGG